MGIKVSLQVSEDRLLVGSSSITLGDSLLVRIPEAQSTVFGYMQIYIDNYADTSSSKIWDQMWKSSMFYGRKGLPVAVLSVIDLALWDLLGHIRQEPVYQMIGGAVREQVEFYCTGPDPIAIKNLGFRAAKVPLPFGPDTPDSIQRNVNFLKANKESIGDFPLRVDCWMSLNVRYAIRLASECQASGVKIDWFEEVLHPDDSEGYQKLQSACPEVTWTTGEHEYSRYGFRKLIESRNIDILQPDVMWCGGLTELLRISAMAQAYDIPIVPHGSGPYTAHFCITQTNSPYSEYIANSPDGQTVHPCFGALFKDEVMPIEGAIKRERLDRPGFGLTLDYDQVIPFSDDIMMSKK